MLLKFQAKGKRPLKWRHNLAIFFPDWGPRASPWPPKIIPTYACLREAASAKAGQGFGGLSAGERNPLKHDTLIVEMVCRAGTHSFTAKAVVSCVGG